MDANATTPLLPEVFDAMRPFWIEHFGNASSIHQQGQYARAAVDHARDSIARLLHCRTSEVIFTSGGTESDNLALFGTLEPGQHLITTATEHHAVLHAAGARFHTDAVQAASKLPLDLSPNGPLKHVDLLSISGHKLYAPQGTGVLFTRRNVRLAPLFHGGTHERQRRAGTENVPGIAGLGKAAELAQKWLTNEVGAPGPASGTWVQNPTELAALRDRLEQGLLATIEECGVNGAGTPRVANTSNMYFDHVEAEALVIALDLKGLSVSGGSACQSGATEPSHVLTAMGLTPARARASIRFSLSRLTTEVEVDAALQIIPAAVARLRDLSPTWHKAEAVTTA